MKIALILLFPIPIIINGKWHILFIARFYLVLKSKAFYSHSPINPYFVTTWSNVGFTHRWTWKTRRGPTILQSGLIGSTSAQ